MAFKPLVRLLDGTTTGGTTIPSDSCQLLSVELVDVASGAFLFATEDTVIDFKVSGPSTAEPALLYANVSDSCMTAITSVTLSKGHNASNLALKSLVTGTVTIISSSKQATADGILTLAVE